MDDLDLVAGLVFDQALDAAEARVAGDLGDAAPARPRLTRGDALAMLGAIAERLDYDLHKSYFDAECEEEDGVQEEMQAELLDALAPWIEVSP